MSKALGYGRVRRREAEIVTYFLESKIPRSSTRKISPSHNVEGEGVRRKKEEEEGEDDAACSLPLQVSASCSLLCSTSLAGKGKWEQKSSLSALERSRK